MCDTPSTIPITKRQAIQLVSVPILLMLGLSLLLLLQDGPDLVRVFDVAGIRDRLPVPTAIILATYKAWIAIPLIALVAVFDYRRRRTPSARHTVALLMTCFVVAGLMTWIVVSDLYGALIRLNLMTMTR
jgi:hypothetical protein